MPLSDDLFQQMMQAHRAAGGAEKVTKAAAATSAPQPAPAQTAATIPAAPAAPSVTEKKQAVKPAPELMEDLKLEDFYRNVKSSNDIGAAVMATHDAMPIRRYRELAGLQGVDLDDLAKNAAAGMPFENYKKMRRDVVGFLPPAERAPAVGRVVEDFQAAQKGEIPKGRSLELEAAEEAPLSVGGVLGGYVVGGTSAEETPEVAKPGEHYYAVAKTLVDELDKKPEVVKLVELYGRSYGAGATQKYINDRTRQLMKDQGITPDTPDADRRARLARRQALYEVLARKTVGQWTPGVFVKDVEVTDDAKATDNPLAALAPNIELIGFNSKGKAVFRQESPAGVMLRTLDVVGVSPVSVKGVKVPIPGQALLAGLATKEDNESMLQAMSRGVQTGASWVDVALEATEGKSLPVRAAAGLVGLAGAVAHPDVTAAAGAVNKAQKAYRVGRVQKAIFREADPVLTRLVEAYKAGMAGDDEALEAAQKLEKEMASNELLGRQGKATDGAGFNVINQFNRNDAAFIQSMTAMDPTIKSTSSTLMEDMVLATTRTVPEIAEVVYDTGVRGYPYMHFAAAVGELGFQKKNEGLAQTAATYLSAANFPLRRKRIKAAKEAFIAAAPKNADDAVKRIIDDEISALRRTADDAVVAGVPMEQTSRQRRMADLLDSFRGELIDNPRKFLSEESPFYRAVQQDPILGGVESAAFRGDFYRKTGGPLASRVRKLKELDFDTVLRQDVERFDDALRAIDMNIKSRAMAAESLRRNLAERANIEVTPIDILDEVLDEGTERLSPLAQSQFFGTMRQLPEGADRKGFLRAFQVLDQALRAKAENTGATLEDMWRELLIRVERGEEQLPQNVRPVKPKAAPPRATPPAVAPAAAPAAPPAPVAQAPADAAAEEKAIDKAAKAVASKPAAPKVHERTAELLADLDPALKAKPEQVSRVLTVFDQVQPGEEFAYSAKQFPGISKVLFGAIRDRLVDAGSLVRTDDAKFVRSGRTIEEAVTEAKAVVNPTPAAKVESAEEAVARRSKEEAERLAAVRAGRAPAPPAAEVKAAEPEVVEPVKAPEPEVVEAPKPVEPEAPVVEAAVEAAPAAPTPVFERAPVEAPPAKAKAKAASGKPTTLADLGKREMWTEAKPLTKTAPTGLTAEVEGRVYDVFAVPLAGKKQGYVFNVTVATNGQREFVAKFDSLDEAVAAFKGTAKKPAPILGQLDTALKEATLPLPPEAIEEVVKAQPKAAKIAESLSPEAEAFSAQFPDIFEDATAITKTMLKRAAKRLGTEAADDTALAELEKYDAAAKKLGVDVRKEFAAARKKAQEEAAKLEAMAAPPPKPATVLSFDDALEQTVRETETLTHEIDDPSGVFRIFGTLEGDVFVPKFRVADFAVREGQLPNEIFNQVRRPDMGIERTPMAAGKLKMRAVRPAQLVAKIKDLAERDELYQTGIVDAEKGVGRLVTKGMAEFPEPGSRADNVTTIITLYRDVADPTTLLHEVGHYIRKMVLDANDMDSVTAWLKSKGIRVEHKFGEFVGAEDEVRRAEEAFAQGFEEYLASGRAPRPELDTLFARVAETFAKVYRTLTRGPIGEEISPEVRAVFDRLFSATPAKKPESTFDVLLRETRGGDVTTPEGALDVLSREAVRRGIPIRFDGKPPEASTREALAKKIAPFVKNKDQGFMTATVLEFPAPVFGKTEWTGADIVALNTRIQQRSQDLSMAPLKQALFGAAEEAAPTESILTAVAAREEGTAATAGRAVARGFAYSILGGDIVAERSMRDLVPEIRRNIDTSARILEQSINDTIKVVSESIRAGEPELLYRFLAGEEGMTYRSGRRVVSSGQEFIDGFLQLYRNAWSTLQPEEQALLQDFAKAMRSRPNMENLSASQLPSEALERVLFPALSEVAEDSSVRKAMQARRDTMFAALDKFRELQGSGDKSVGSQLAKSMSSAVGERRAPTFNDYRFAETLLYLSGATPRNGDYFRPVDEAFTNENLKDAARTLLSEAQNIYGKDGDDIVARRLGILVGAYGASARAKAELAGLGMVLTAEEAAAFKAWTLGSGVSDAMRPRIEGAMRKFGANTQFVADTILGADVYIPVQARQRIMDVLGKAQFSNTRLTKLGDIYQTVFAFMKKRMTRGNLVLRQRYFMVNTIDHFFQMSLVVGFGPALQSTSRIAMQNVMASLLGQSVETLNRLASRVTGGRIAPDAAEKIRDILSRGGDRTAQALGRMMSTSKYRVEVNDILEGRNIPIVLGGQVTTAKRLREIFVAEGMMEGFDTRRLGAVIRQEGTAFIDDGDGMVDAGLRDGSLGGNVGSAWAKVRDAATDLTFDVVDDLGDAWAERERIGAAVTLIEAGFDPRAACRLAVDGLYDYAQTMTKGDRNWLWGLLFPFWAFQKNANQQFVNTLFSPAGAYRMMALQRARDGSTELLTELYYGAVGGELGLDVSAMPQDMQDLYYAVMTEAHNVYGDEIPAEARRALRMMLTNRISEVVDGQYVEIDERIMGKLRAGGVGGVSGVGMADYLLPEPSKSGLPSYVRERPGVALPQRRNALVRHYAALSGLNDEYFYLMLPSSSVEEAFKHIATMFGTAALISGKVAGIAPGTDLQAKGVEGTDILRAIQPVIDLERSPIAGPVIGMYADRGYPQRLHPFMASILQSMSNVPILRVPAAKDPFVSGVLPMQAGDVDDEGKPLDMAKILGEDYVRSVQELNSKDIDPRDLESAKKERYYLPPGGYSIAFENTLGEFNKALLQYDARFTEQGFKMGSEKEKADALGKVLLTLRNLTGLDVITVSGTQTARMEEPVIYKKTKEPF